MGSRRPPRRLSRRVPLRRLSRRLPRRLSRRLLPRRPQLNAMFQRTEDVDQNTVTLSAQPDTVHNGGGVVHQLYTKRLTKPNMTLKKLVPLRRLSRRPPRRLSRRPPRRLSRRLNATFQRT